jgi:quercetin dioxygenase-like cupin family protein
LIPPREFKRTPGERPLLAIAGGVYDILAGGDETGGQYALVENTLPPDNGPPPHTHTREDEAFYVLAGEMTFTVGGREHLARAGTLLHAPRGVPHAYRNTGRTPARMLVWITPAGIERFFHKVGEPLPHSATEAPPATEAHLMKIVELAPKYGLTIHAPSA